MDKRTELYRGKAKTVFATDDPTSEQFLELLEQAERRLSARKQGC